MLMDEFLKSYFPSIKNLKKEQLPGDGGHRQYIRLQLGKQTFMLMSCGEKDHSLKKFVEIQKKLDSFILVPKIFHKSLNQGLLLLEDLGDQNLEQFFFQNREQPSLTFYHQALTHLICFQSKIIPSKADTLFDKKFFLSENETAIYHLQTYVNHLCKKKIKPFHEQSSISFKKDMEDILSAFKLKDYVYCHRDYHSRNLMLKNDKIVLIDFQDAGLGPWYYDLTSLLYDSYVPLNSSIKDHLSLFYFENLSSPLKKKVGSLAHLQRMIKLQFLQRGFKACGCFAAFQNLNQKNTHLKYVYPTLKLLENTALELSYIGIYQYVQKLTETLKEWSVGTTY